MSKKLPVIVSRDISWLSFNDRVLQEAEDPNVPLMERLRFLGIFSNNRDEFFKVRVATIRRMLKFGKKAKDLLGSEPSKLLEKIQKIVIEQQKKFDLLFINIVKELEKNNIFIVNEKKLNPIQAEYVRDYFHDKVFPFIVPVMIDSAPKFPYLKDKMMYLAVRIKFKGKDGKLKYSIIEIPTDVLNRFLVLPGTGEKKSIILLEDIIRFCMDDIYSMFEYETIEGYTIKMTRDAEMDIDGDISKSWVEKISKGVKSRTKGDPVRLVYDEKIPKDLLNFIVKKLKFKESEYIIPGGRYHNFRDFISFPRVGVKELYYRSVIPLEHPALVNQKSILNVIKQQDVLLSFPYHTFNHIVDLLREAAIDPQVQSIKITLYRASAQSSSIVNALVNAVKNGKKVSVVVELQARFDEESNIFYANKLQEEGAEVIFGVPGLKVHSKLCLITRKENNKNVNYAYVGTGNFNEQTARIYADHGLMTANKTITTEIERLFGFYRDNYKTGHYKNIIVSPFNTRKRFTSMINKEIENAEANKPAWMILKMNSLVDNEMISRLYEASQAGVKIQLIVRGVCSLVPGIPGMSENISVTSIVDRFLEHSRIYVFCNGGDERIYIASGDWMYRNLDHRSEVAVPILDNEIKKELKNYLSLQLRDNIKARAVDQRQQNLYVRNNNKPIRSQAEIYKYIAQKAVVTPRAKLEKKVIENATVFNKPLIKTSLRRS